MSATWPRPEGEGGWELPRTPAALRARAGLDAEALVRVAREEQLLFGGELWSLAIARRGVLAEIRSPTALEQTRFEVHSVTKAVTSLGFGMLIDELARCGRAGELTLDTRVYDVLRDAPPPADARKRDVTVRHLLSMTAGYAGPAEGSFGTVTRPGDGLFEHVLGLVPDRDGIDVAQLAAAPGERWAYSDVGFAHLSLVFSAVAGEPLDAYVQRRLLTPIGVERAAWGRAGGGGPIGPHTVCHTGLVLSARELARLGLLVLRGGAWDGAQLVPQAWVAAATGSSQELNRSYGLGFWVNAGRALWPAVPEDAFAMVGFRGNRCWVVPSLELVVARTATGPALLDDRHFPLGVLDAIVA